MSQSSPGPSQAAQQESSGRVAFARVGGTPDLAEAVAAVDDPRAGATVTFLGVVRDHDHGRAVRALDYSAHPDAERALAALAEQVAADPGVVAVAVHHASGSLVIGGVAVVAAVSAGHRGQAFEACESLINRLKAQVPIWKHQYFTDGEDEWVGTP